MDWLNTPVDVPISELIARKKRARMIEMLRAQLEGRLAPGVQVRLQLADLLVQAGRGEEAVPVLIGLADQFAADGFVAKAIAILKRVEKVHQGRHDVASRLTALVQQQQRAARSARAEGSGPRRPVELGIEEFDDSLPPELEAEAPPLPRDEPIEAAAVPESAPPAVESVPPATTVEPAAEVASAAAPPSAGVAQRIRGVFKRFLASLPSPPESGSPPQAASAPLDDRASGGAQPPERETSATSESAAPADAPGTPDAPAPPPVPLSEDTGPLNLGVAADAPPLEAPADDLEITLEPDSEPTPAELSEQAYEDHLLDIVEDVLQRPAAAGAPVERPLVVEYAQRLLAMPLFSDLSEDELLAVVRGLRVHTFAAGDVIVTERERGQSLFILTSGRVKVFVRNPAGRNYPVAQLRSGDFFGEIASLSGRPRSATVVAAAATDILELDKPALDGIARTHPRVCDVLEQAYIQRASSPEAAAIRAVPLNDPLSDQRAIEVLEAHFGESRWDPRMRLRLADVLVRAGKEPDAVPILVGLADDLAREGYPEKAISILKKIEQLQRRNIEEVSLAPRLHEDPVEAVADAPAPVPAASPARRARARTDEFFHAWLLDTVRDAVGRARTARQPTPVRALQSYGPGFRASPLFEGFDEDELLAVIQGLRLLTFAPGGVIVTEGEPGQSVFILASGTVKVFVRSPEGHDVPVCTLGVGSFFGEMSTLSGQPRSATVTAASPCDLLELDRAALDRIAVRHPNVRAVLEEFSRRRAADPAAAAARGTSGDPRS
jgi:CRP-like cAMP-binding protein